MEQSIKWLDQYKIQSISATTYQTFYMHHTLLTTAFFPKKKKPTALLLSAPYIIDHRITAIYYPTVDRLLDQPDMCSISWNIRTCCPHPETHQTSAWWRKTPPKSQKYTSPDCRPDRWNDVSEEIPRQDNRRIVIAPIQGCRPTDEHLVRIQIANVILIRVLLSHAQPLYQEVSFGNAPSGCLRLGAPLSLRRLRAGTFTND